MATKLIVLCIALFAFRFSHGLEERSFTDGINATVTQIENIAKGILAPIEQGIDRTISDARKIITESSARAEEIVNTVIKVAQNLSANFIAGIEANLNKAMESGKNVSACEAKSLQGAAVIVNATVVQARACTIAALEPATEVTNELLNIAKLALEVVVQIPNQVLQCFSSGLFGLLGCESKVVLDITSRGGMLAAAAAADGLKVAGMTVSLPLNVGKCQIQAVTFAATQFRALNRNTTQCIDNALA